MKLSKINIKQIFWILSFTTLVVMLLLSRSAGISGDEHVNYEHAEFVYNFYKTAGKDTTALNTPETKLKYYGQSFDNITYVVNKTLNIEKYFESRHLLNTISGWLLMLFTALTAYLIFGWKAGIITFVLMFFSPIILGHSWNNPKDIPFAFTYAFSIFFLVKFLKELPKIDYSSAIFLSLGIAGSISIRIGGLVIIPYLFLFLFIYYIFKKRFYSKAGFLNALKACGVLIVVSIAGYFIGLVFWPFALKAPILNPMEALKEMTNFEVGLNQLFEGKVQLSKEIPWYYGIKYLLIKSPIILIPGIVLFLLTFPFFGKFRSNYTFYSLLLFAFVFPIAYTIYKESNLYGACRHLLWTYGPIVILSAGGFNFLLERKNKYIRYITLGIMVILLFHPVKHTFKNHPHQYVYYNQFIGGVDNAFGQYELDYYYHGLKAASEWLMDNKLSEDTITVATNHIKSVKYYFRNKPNVKVVYSRFYEKCKSQWDYSIWANTHVTPVQLEKGHWPPRETIHTIDVDNTPIAAIVKRISDEDYKGFEAMKAQKIKLAKKHFKSFLKIYPECEEVYEGYARTCLLERKTDSTIIYADSSLYYNPRQIGALLLKASAYNYRKDYEKALPICEKAINVKESFAEAHYQKGVALRFTNKPNEALKEFTIASAYKKEYYEAQMQIGSILSNYKKYDQAIKQVYSKVLRFRKKDLGAIVATARCYHFLKQNNNALNLLNEIPKPNQNNFEVVKLKTRIALQNGNLNEAGQLLNRARNIHTNSDLSVIRALYLLKANRPEQAKEFVNKAIEQDKTNREASELLTSLTKPKSKVQTKTNNPQKSIMFQKPKGKTAIGANPLQTK